MRQLLRGITVFGFLGSLGVMIAFAMRHEWDISLGGLIGVICFSALPLFYFAGQTLRDGQASQD